MKKNSPPIFIGETYGRHFIQRGEEWRTASYTWSRRREDAALFPRDLKDLLQTYLLQARQEAKTAAA